MYYLNMRSRDRLIIQTSQRIQMANTNEKTITVFKGNKQKVQAIVLDELNNFYVVKLPRGKKQYDVFKTDMKLRQ